MVSKVTNWLKTAYKDINISCKSNRLPVLFHFNIFIYPILLNKVKKTPANFVTFLQNLRTSKFFVNLYSVYPGFTAGLIFAELECLGYVYPADKYAQYHEGNEQH